MERLWAYLTIKDLLERVARGDLNSCRNHIKRQASSAPFDDEDYTSLEGSGHDNDDDYYGDDDEKEDNVEEIVNEVGDDENFVICDNIERALYLSLKYEFVTPLTSLVVVGPDDNNKEGDLSEIEGHKRRHTINFMSAAPQLTKRCHQALFAVIIAFFTLLTSQDLVK